MHLKAPERLLQFQIEFRMFDRGGPGFDHNRKVHGSANPCPSRAKKLTNPAFDPIAAHSIADFAANADAQTCC